MKNSLRIVTDTPYKEIISKKENLEFIISKNTFECNSRGELIEKLGNIQESFFISQLKIINVLNKDDYDKICSIDLSTRNGLNHKVVTNIGNYRFTEVCSVNNNNILIRRYFIINFNKTITINKEEYSNQVFELDINSFCILISEICSAKQDIEDKLEIDEAVKYLIHIEKVIDKLIEKYFDRLALNNELMKF